MSQNNTTSTDNKNNVFLQNLKESTENLEKMFNVIENSKLVEINKITTEAISNLIIENPMYFFSLIKFCIFYSEKGNKKICKEIRAILEKIFAEVDFKDYILKLFAEHCLDIIKLINNNDIISICIEDGNFMIKEGFNDISSNIIKDLNLSNIERLLAPKTNSDKPIFDEFENKLNVRILVGDDKDLIKDFEELKNTNTIESNSPSTKRLIQQEYIKYTSVIKFITLEQESNKKKPNLSKDEKYIKKRLTFDFLPISILIDKLIKLNSSFNWNVRVSSIVLLDFLVKYESLMTGYTIQYDYLIDKNTNLFYCIEETQVLNQRLFIGNDQLVKFKSSILVTLIVNSLLDQVSDFNHLSDICLFKDMNLSTASKIFNLIEEKSKEEIIISLVSKFSELKLIKDQNEDWHPMYAILLFFQKLNFNENFYKEINFFNGFINSYNNLLKYNHEVVILANDILLKVLKVLFSYDKINKELIWSVFCSFINFADNFDDIEYTIEGYLFCFINFLELFIIKDCILDFKVIEQFCENNFLKFSLNLMLKVRITTFKAFIRILPLYSKNINDDFVKYFCTLAYQTICIEEDEEILNAAYQLLNTVVINFPLIKKPFIKHLLKNYKNFYKLHVKDNINNLKYLYIPKFSNDSNPSLLYTGFFKNDCQIEEILLKKTNKHLRTLPFFADLLISEPTIFENMINCFHFDPSSILISNTTLQLVMIYTIYLEKIEFLENKVLFISYDLFLPLLDSIFIAEAKVRMDKSEANDMIIRIKFIIEYLEKNKNFNLIFMSNSCLTDFNSKVFSLIKVTELINELNKLPKTSDLTGLINKFTNKIQIIKQKYDSIKIQFRAYSAGIIFQTMAYSGLGIDKVTNYVNSFINILKINTPLNKTISKLLLRLMYTNVKKEEAYTKILSNFFNNAILTFTEELKAFNIKENKIMKDITKLKNLSFIYFIEYLTIHNNSFDLIKIVNDYFTSSNSNINKLIFTYLLIQSSNTISIFPDYLPLRLFDYSVLSQILKDFFLISNYNDDQSSYSLLLQIIIEELAFLFKENNYNSVLTDLFNLINSNNYDTLRVISLLNSLFDKTLSDNYDTIQIKQISGCDFNFRLSVAGRIIDVLKLINSNDSNIKALSFSFFSKLIKTVSQLKLNESYKALEEKNKYLKGFFSSSYPSDLKLNFDLKIKLREYQLNGIKWLSFLGSFGLSAALCDDMGLGKTVQTLVTILNESLEVIKKDINRNPISMVVCPNSLSYNWIKEYNLFFNTTDDNSSFLICKVNTLTDIPTFIKKNANTNKPLLIISSYEKIKESEINILKSLSLFYLVFDEAHILKNPKTKLYMCLSQVKAERKIMLSGTPIQNNILELYSLFDLIMPGFFGKKSDFDTNYNKKAYSTLQKIDLQKKLQDEMFQASIAEIKKWVKPFILRRIKSEVLKDLPEKQIEDFMCEMPTSQEYLYKYYSNKYKISEIKSDDIIQFNSKEVTSQNNNIPYIQKIGILMKIINNPPYVENELIKEFIDNSLIHYPELLNYTIEVDQSIESYSNKIKKIILKNNAKLDALEEILNELGFNESILDNPNKILIFSNYNANLDTIKDYLLSKIPFINDKNIKIFSSSLNDKERFNLVEKFNHSNEIKFLLLNTSIGGLGLSLTSANIVIMYDHSWNPMKDLQAMDRAHRLGQRKTVQVFRLIVKDSIEEKLISLQNFKKFIANAIITYSESTDSNINLNSFMESFETGNINIDKLKVSKVKDNKLKRLIKGESIDDEEEEDELEFLKKIIN
jgi:SNF2 family DNA or RNA helicase